MMESYVEARCDYCDDGFWTVDAWRDEEEDGKVVAILDEGTGRVFYIEPEARLSPRVEEAILGRKLILEHWANLARLHKDIGNKENGDE